MENERAGGKEEVINLGWERQGGPSAAYLHLYARIFADILGNKEAEYDDTGPPQNTMVRCAESLQSMLHEETD